MSERTMEFNSEQFSRNAAEFFRDKPESVNGIGTIRLLLYLDAVNDTYRWSAVDETATLADIRKDVEHGMEQMALAPLGAVFLSFEMRNKRVYLSQGMPVLIDKQLTDAEVMDVLNGTVPFFMEKHFGYRLDDLVFSCRRQDIN